MSDKILRLAAANDQLLVLIADSKDTVEYARQIHQTSPVVSAALGRLLTGTAMMGLLLKDKKDLLTLRMRGDGPLEGLLATANNHGEVKGYALHPQVEVPNKANGKLNVGGVIGQGTLTVIRDTGEKEPFSGTVELLSGEVAEDIAYYFVQSEQKPSAVALGVHVAPDYHVDRAGGYLIQALPDADPALLDELQAKLATLPSVTELYGEGHTPESIAELIFGEYGYTLEEEIPLSFTCSCNRDTIARLLISLGRQELQAMAEEDHGADVACQFCGRSYHFTEDELKKLAEQAQLLSRDVSFLSDDYTLGLMEHEKV